jgi:glucosyl-dolichyl phosphate glucuronosyltransferase
MSGYHQLPRVRRVRVDEYLLESAGTLPLMTHEFDGIVVGLDTGDAVRGALLISIVVLSYSDERLADIRDLLASIDDQTYHSIELVFVVERSTKILGLLSETRLRYPKRIYFTEQKMSVAQARNIAIKIATGDVIAYIDDDARLTPEWAESLHSALARNPDAIGVTGSISPDWEVAYDENVFPKSLYWVIGCTAWREFTVPRLVESAQSLNTAYRREVFNGYGFRIHQFNGASLHSGLQGDDVDFALRVTNGMKRKLYFDPSVKVMHKVPHSRIRITYVSRYAFWQGFTEARYRRRELAKERNSSAFSPLLKTLIHDLSPRKGSKLQLQATLLAALLSFGFGYIRYLVIPHA